MADSGLKICAGLTLVLASIPILGALYARTYQYYWSSYGLFALSAFVFAMSVCSYIGYRTIKQGTPFLLRFLGRLNNVLTPVAHYLSHNKVIGPLFSVVIRANFFVSFMVLLLGDQLLRAVVGRFVGRHAKRWNLSVANAVDPYFHFFDDTIPEFTEAHQDTSQSQNKQHIINRLGRPIDTIPKYSPRLAYTLSIASKLVYEDVGVLEHELEKDGFDMTTFRPMAYRNICAFIAKKDNDILLVFRGTNPLNIQNFVTNITVGMKEINSMGKVHKGFWEAMGEPTPHTLPHNSTFKIELNGASLYRTVMSAVNAVLEIVRFATRHMLHHFSDPVDSSWIGFDTDIRSRSMFSQAEGHILDICQNSKDQPIRLYITGHSLGGAMATTKMMQSKSPLMDHFAGLYTYGQPNVGDENFTRAFGPQISDKIFRHAYNNDIVSRIPHFSFYKYAFTADNHQN
ncbi:hypothetical protein DFQ28_008713 [Apophysomyces sp. BC1034]|nr:hypothetical protein DFQ28_008713 [Apophysomyces sp. BC1034]